jgi:CDP-diglyceride synthetase
MTWKRVATAVVLVPLAVGLVLWGSTAIIAIAVALVTLLALFEYFALAFPAPAYVSFHTSFVVTFFPVLALRF